MRISRASGVELTVFAWFAALGCSGDAHDVSRVEIASAFGLVFSPVYSAYDCVHEFRVPVAPDGATVVDRWEVVDTEGGHRDDAVEISDDPEFGGVTLKTRKAGDFFVLAHSGQQTGCSELHVTAGQADQWALGQSRYQELYAPALPEPSQATDWNTTPEMFSCSNCHGDGPSFLAAEFTPLQSGGFSDENLIALWTSGTRPSQQLFTQDGICKKRSLARNDGPPQDVVAWFHATTFTPQESSALLLYMRSLPSVSRGMLDLGGVLPREPAPIP